ncbi:MAG: FAD-dependent thymidylate synthase [Desulfovibrio sp.]|jgi:thymidylate synthase (FAD)|nr:FAD-dependent thymidylate synthase [Desulfovibrio sp.]
MPREKFTGSGKVLLIAGGGRIYTDIAARFVKSERSLEEIIASPYSRELVAAILSSGHKAALEFDFFLFGVEGYSRVTETQLVRKRIASYLIKSGRAELGGKRAFSLVYPEEIGKFAASVPLPPEALEFPPELGEAEREKLAGLRLRLDARLLGSLSEQWYGQGLLAGLAEEDLRYMKPQATEFKAIIGMNAHALLDWFAIRCCRNAQAEIRDLAGKMLDLCKKQVPDLFRAAGPACVQLGYCPENKAQNKQCAGIVPTRDEALEILRRARKSARAAKKGGSFQN